MNITIFNKNYWVRRLGEQKVIKGIVTNGKTDFIASLHIHPTSTDQQMALPEGERKIKRLEGHGSVVLKTANQDTGEKGDLLLYFGDWYECVSAQLHDHTILSHINYQFTLVPRDAAGTIDTANPPEEDPSGKEEGEGVFTPDSDVTVAGDDTVGYVIVKAGSGLVVDKCGNLSLDEATLEALKSMLGGGSD